MMGGAVAQPVFTLSAILAGSSFATDALFIVLVFVCDELVIEHPQTDLCLFVDDLTLHTVAAATEELG